MAKMDIYFSVSQRMESIRNALSGLSRVPSVWIRSLGRDSIIVPADHQKVVVIYFREIGENVSVCFTSFALLLRYQMQESQKLRASA